MPSTKVILWTIGLSLLATIIWEKDMFGLKTAVNKAL